jgi:hypothetical protein
MPREHSLRPGKARRRLRLYIMRRVMLSPLDPAARRHAYHAMRYRRLRGKQA